jgi:methyl-accepting chemotaxis protein
LTSSLALFLLLVVNIGFWMLQTSQSSTLAAVAPQLSPVLEKQDATFSAVLIVLSLAFIAGVFVITVVETHRTAGSVFAVKQRIGRVRDGDLHVSLNFRPQDTLLDLKDPFNEMVASLREKEISEADELDRLADEASKGALPEPVLLEKLRTIALKKRDAGS